MDTPATENKTGDALKAQRFQMLEDIAKELEGDVVFPTCFDVTLRLRKVLNDPEISLPRLVAVLSAEPLISGKILHLANSVAYNPQGNQCRDLLAAIQRIGLQAVRSTALALAMKQLLLSKEMVCFKELMANLWEHSVETACAAKVLARKYTRLNPEEALLAGLMHDLGAFYMLYRAAHYEELRIRPVRSSTSSPSGTRASVTCSSPPWVWTRPSSRPPTTTTIPALCPTPSPIWRMWFMWPISWPAAMRPG